VDERSEYLFRHELVSRTAGKSAPQVDVDLPTFVLHEEEARFVTSRPLSISPDMI
jgi:hypothetical protein